MNAIPTAVLTHIYIFGWKHKSCVVTHRLHPEIREMKADEGRAEKKKPGQRRSQIFHATSLLNGKEKTGS